MKFQYCNTCADRYGLPGFLVPSLPRNMAGMCDVCRIYTKKVREIKIPQLAEEIRNQHDLARSAIADIREALCHIKNNMSQTMAPFEAQWIPRAIENAEEAPKHPIEKFFE